ncbi:GxxExxY protein, partial [Patescibacteria group bacterium]|nr:GxxExxY protein [Patescibacteria group bacterium]
RGACFKIWKEFGGAFKETIVDRALSIELKKLGFTVEDQKRIDIIYEGEKVGTYIPDKIIDNKIVLEIKCKPFITFEDKKQFWYYLKASPYKLGLLINFGPKRIEIYRRVYDKARYQRKSA